MKKVIYFLTIIGFVFMGCDPNEDIYSDIDAIETPIVGTDMYTLTADDYAELELSYGSFSSVDDAKILIPGLLSDLYPYWGNGSSVLVGYELYIGNAEGVSDYSGADIYELSNDDYASTGSDAFGFYPNVDSNDHIPGILDTAITGPTEGQIVLAKYKQYFDDPVVGLADIVLYNFVGSMEGWSTEEEFGDDDVWTAEPAYVQGNSYFGGQVANTEWLVSPAIDLTGESDLKFQITQELDYAGDASLLKILVSTDYSGDVLTATWDEITLANPATGDMAPSEDYDFSAYDGQIINVAFRYESSDTDAGRWRIASMAIKTIGVSGDTNNKGTHFAYTDGDWEPVDGVYYLSSADFDSMGESSGQPGQYDNFGSSVPPGDYLPTFLSLNSPWAFGQEEDEVIMIYDYYSSSSGAQIRGNRYTVISGMWVGHESTISTTLQFGHDGTEWVPDNTIRYTMTGGDYDAVGAEFETIYPGPAGSVANYHNFDRRVGNANEWTDSMVVEALNVVLDNLDPSAAEEQKYIVTADIYNGSNTTEDFAVVKQGGVWVSQ